MLGEMAKCVKNEFFQNKIVPYSPINSRKFRKNDKYENIFYTFAEVTFFEF